MTLKDLLNTDITLEKAKFIYETYGIGFNIKDGHLKAFNL